MIPEAPSFFTLDRGTVSTAATLIAPVEGRYRMLAASAAPAAIDPEAMLEDLAWRVARTDASVAGSMGGWREWSRLEVRSTRPPRACLVAASAETGSLLERAFVGAGWHVAARFFGPEPDLIALGGACLEPSLDAVVMAGRDDADQEERDRARLLWPRTGALARLRNDLAIIACGPFIERPEGIPDDRLFSLPAPGPAAAGPSSPLFQAAAQVGAHLVSGGDPLALDSRSALRRSVSSLAVLLGKRVDGIEVGAAAASRTLANPDGELRHAVLASAGLLPHEILDDDEAAEAVLRWSAVAGDPATRLDRIRELVLHPWSAIDGDGLHLRLAMLRTALERLQQGWDSLATESRPDDAAADVLVLAGGGFALLPAAAAALAVADGVRRPGAFTILHDHAAVLAPLGALPVEGDRRRLLADLMDDCLLPVGSVVLTGAPGEPGKDRGRVTITTPLFEDELPLEPGLRLVDLPPGIVARLEIDPGQGSLLGVSGQRFGLEVSGGLGGLLLDMRPIPLELPSGAEQRRALLEAWEEPAWVGSDR
ncbi:MAG TPA: hypothetical protein VFF55_01170 [Candidatus Deferrimicrobium sp.]|nr:hypothetical protein [Candidatus Deferrimicrobium sp.]